jgi:hypothetical protein
MTQRNDVMIDKVFQRLVTAPNELNPTVAEVLIACGRFVGAILKEGYADGDRDRVMAWFIGGLRSYVARSNARASPDRQIRESDQWSPGQSLSGIHPFFGQFHTCASAPERFSPPASTKRPPK